MELTRAAENEIYAVSRIYEAVKGGEFCVWSESYPTREHAILDQRAGCLYVLKDGGKIVGCGSVEPEAEDNDLPFWRINDGTHREISRIAISPKHQGRGYAKILVSLLIEELRAEGVRSVHLLAAKKNPPAFRTYRSLGFEFLGECHRYGADYYVCELLL